MTCEEAIELIKTEFLTGEQGRDEFPEIHEALDLAIDALDMSRKFMGR